MTNNGRTNKARATSDKNLHNYLIRNSFDKKGITLFYALSIIEMRINEHLDIKI
jgi:hypothetical protein